MSQQLKGFRAGTWVILRSLPSHRASFEGKPAYVMHGGELDLRDIKNWNGQSERMLGYRVIPQGRDPNKPIRVPLVCAYTPDTPLDRYGDPVQMGEQPVVRSEARATAVRNLGTSEAPIYEFVMTPGGSYAE